MEDASPLSSQNKKSRLLPTRTGTVFVIGNGDIGQLGLGEDMLNRKRPMPLRALDDKEIVDIVSGGLHTLALTSNGKLYSWGCNDQRALGRDTSDDDGFEPGLVEGLDDVVITKIAAGDSISLALTDDGKLYCWGTFRCKEGQLGFSKGKPVQDTAALFTPLASHNIIDIAAGTDHCLALADNGDVYSWGDGACYQLGRRVIERRKTNALQPERVGLRNATMVAAGAYHSFAVVGDDLYVWGLNNFQQCGIVDADDNVPAVETVEQPTLVAGLQGKSIKSVHAGEHHSLVLLNDGSVFAFGRADSSQLGLPAATIEELQTRADNQDSAHKKAVGIPTQVPGLGNVESLACGSNHALTVLKDGSCYAWGFGESAALGQGNEDDQPVPALVTGQKLEGKNVFRAAAGAQHSVLLADE
ncbi:regulator of chromosome condensation 1/beta-lactamase-inhibitor protein II [Gongronella butleri]|nr:regulator of chromosome condensation 1/beta-lactamase-inhibitor protein II [Gongronella butleri]